MSYHEKHQEAIALIEQVKTMNAEGINDAETAAKATRMAEDAHKLMGEVREAKLAEDKERTAKLLEEFEAKAKAGEVSAPAKAPAAKVEPKAPEVGAWEAKGPQAERFLKALAEGTGSSGGFLVPPQYMQNLFAETRRQGNALRRYGLLNVIPTNSYSVLIPQGSGAASVDWTAENATKPSADQTYAQITVAINVLAGISKVPNQLVQDADPAVPGLVGRELGSLMGNSEEAAIIDGPGTGQPKGILGTSGVNTVTADGTSGQAIIDNILDAIVAVQTTYYGPPNAILMHPRRWAYLLKTKDSQNNYIINPAANFRMASGMPAGTTSVTTGDAEAMPTVLGLPVALTANMPTNKGGGTNEDRIIVGDFNQALWFERQGQTLDVSAEAGTAFETNQTWFRLEERAGFTAARYPKAFAVVQGTNLNLT